ncbi:receptor-type tyrosine-protein phosphatase gamma-like isoform X8 [Synchiropus splendidus]|nr:receptor-type tyrosine-protein phosphatase gamma-like isoform X8 [Synchiropus splendidus]
MWRLLQPCWCRGWIGSLLLAAWLLLRAHAHPALTGSKAASQALIQGPRRATAGETRLRRAATEDTYWAYSGTYGPGEGWAAAYPQCQEKKQSPINIVDQDTKVSTEYQELTLEGFDTESSNKTSMKNTGKTVAIMLKDDYFVRGAGLPGRFKAEKVEFHWGPSNGSEGSEHSINGRRFPVEMQIYMYNSDDFDSLSAALREKRIIAAMAVFFQAGGKDNPAVDPVIHGLRGVVHHEKETFLEPFVLKDLLPSSLGSYYRYTGSLTTPPCSKVVEWLVFSRPILLSYKQLESFYSIFTTEQQDHVKSVEYLRSNFRPTQSLDNRIVYKSAVKEAWQLDLSEGGATVYSTEASKVCSSAPINMKVQHVNGSSLVVRWTYPEVTYHPPILHFLVSYSWTAHEDSFEETHLTDARHRLEAIISPVSPDVLYLFRVQAICTNDMRSDFSQSMLFRANTTRIFEGTRIVKTGMPTVSPASSADMAPISSGSSTWTSSGIPFSFVSMATGMGPSSSGSQATVASVVTSTLLAGLGFSGGVISAWPCRAQQSQHQLRGGAVAGADAADDSRSPAAEDGQEEEEEEGEGKEEKTKKKVKKPSASDCEDRSVTADAAVEQEAGSECRHRLRPGARKGLHLSVQAVWPRDLASVTWRGRGPGWCVVEWLLLAWLCSPTLLAVVLLLTLLLCCRRRTPCSLLSVDDISARLLVNLAAPVPCTPGVMESIPVKSVTQHTADLRSNNQPDSSDECQDVPPSSPDVNVASRRTDLPSNQHKDCAQLYEHRRLQLRPQAGKDGSPVDESAPASSPSASLLDVAQGGKEDSLAPSQSEGAVTQYQRTPVLVRCRAGEGGAGERLLRRHLVSAYLTHTPTARTLLVQTEGPFQEQHIFIHSALTEAVSGSQTEAAAHQRHCCSPSVTPGRGGRTRLEEPLQWRERGAESSRGPASEGPMTLMLPPSWATTTVPDSSSPSLHCLAPHPTGGRSGTRLHNGW